MQALLARQTSGFSGADLANLVNEAALLAAKQGADAITSDMVDYAFDKVGVGCFFLGGGTPCVTCKVWLLVFLYVCLGWGGSGCQAPGGLGGGGGFTAAWALLGLAPSGLGFLGARGRGGGEGHHIRYGRLRL